MHALILAALMGCGDSPSKPDPPPTEPTGHAVEQVKCNGQWGAVMPGAGWQSSGSTRAACEAELRRFRSEMTSFGVGTTGLAEGCTCRVETMANEVGVKGMKKPITLGPLTVDRVIDGIRAVGSLLNDCENKRTSTGSGQVTVKFFIDKTGAVKTASIKESSLDDASLERCLMDTLSLAKFPAPHEGGVTIVAVPFSFE